MASLMRASALPNLGSKRVAQRPIAVKPAGLVQALPSLRSTMVQQSYSITKHNLVHKAARKPLQVTAQAAAGGAGATPAKEAPAFKWGANMRDLFIAIGIAVALWFIPPPAGVSAKAWHLLAVFVGTIVGIITTPLPLGAVAVLGLGAAMATKVLTFAEAFSAFASEIPYVQNPAYQLH